MADFPPLKILYIVGQLDNGGAERQLLHLIAHLDRLRFRPYVCSLSKDSPLADELRAMDVEVFVLPKRMSPDLTRLWRVPALIRELRPDIIHTYLFVAGVWGRLGGRLLNIPVIASERNAEPEKKWWMVALDKFLSRWTNLLIANSIAGRDAAIRRGEISLEKSMVIYNGVDLDKFPTSTPEERNRTKSEMGLSADVQVIAIIARLACQKDHRTFLKSFHEIAQNWPNAHALCVGKGPMLNEIRQLAGVMGLTNKIIFTGECSDIRTVLAAADIVVLTSLYEGLPNALLEAMAARLPVVATRVGGVPELVANNETGYLVEAKDSRGVAEAVLCLLRDPESARRMGMAGRRRAENCFNMQQMVEKTEKAYLSLIQSRYFAQPLPSSPGMGLNESSA